MAETTRDAVSLSRPMACETPRQIPRPLIVPEKLGEKVDLKLLARRLLTRDRDRDHGQHETHRVWPARSNCKPLVSGVSTVSGVSGVSRANIPWSDAEEERAAIAEYDGGAPRSWGEALARLDPARPPADISPTRWLRFIDDCGRFIDNGWAARAAALGWGPLDLFGCNREKPFARISQAGLLWLLDGRKLLALTGDTAAIATQSGGKLTLYRRQLETGGVLAWELSAAECRH